MAGTWISERFPRFERAFRALMEQHRELQDEPLHLALAYQPGLPRDPQHVYLFEVVGSRFAGDIYPEREFLETVFCSAPGFPTGFEEPLHLILTNPDEMRVAQNESWPSLTEVTEAIKQGDYRVLYADEVGKPLLLSLQTGAGVAGELIHG